MKILVVDDHALIRTALRGVLGELGRDVTVLEASDCRGAFGLIESQPDLDLVLLDLSLPGIHGLAALEELRTRHPALPVVVLSSANDRASVMQREAHQSGVPGNRTGQLPMNDHEAPLTVVANLK